MRTVFTNHMCAHVWAQGQQKHGRSRAMHFDGDIFYTYNTPLAYRTSVTVEQEGFYKRIVLLNSETYSATSSHHRTILRGALLRNDTLILDVPYVIREYAERCNVKQHVENMDYLWTCYSQYVRLRKNKRRSWYYVPALDDTITEAQKLLDNYNLYRKHIAKIHGRPFSMTEDVRETLAQFVEKCATWESEREQKFAEQRAKEKATAEHNLLLWLNGQPVHTYSFRLLDRVYLRLLDDKVQTTLGAEVPVTHARRIWNFVNKVMQSGEPYAHNGHSVHVGHFTVDSIAVDGTLKAGCHTITYEVMREFAEKQGWTVEDVNQDQDPNPQGIEQEGSR